MDTHGAPHQTPGVTHLDRFTIREIPCRVSAEGSLCRVNDDSETGGNSSLRVAGWWWPSTGLCPPRLCPQQHLYIYVCIYTYMHKYAYTYIHTYICTDIHMHEYLSIYLSIYLYLSLYLSIYVFQYIMVACDASHGGVRGFPWFRLLNVT